MFIKPLEEHRQFDVFLGKGWDNWVRVKFTRNGCEMIKSSFTPSSDALELIFYQLKRRFFNNKKLQDKGNK